MPAVPPHPRHKAIAEIEGHIVRAEVTCAKYLREAEARPDERRAGILLRMAEHHLEQLRRSRETLLAGDEGC
jgi:hypothetical protein